MIIVKAKSFFEKIRKCGFCCEFVFHPFIWCFSYANMSTKFSKEGWNSFSAHLHFGPFEFFVSIYES